MEELTNSSLLDFSNRRSQRWEPCKSSKKQRIHVLLSAHASIKEWHRECRVFRLPIDPSQCSLLLTCDRWLYHICSNHFRQLWMEEKSGRFLQRWEDLTDDESIYSFGFVWHSFHQSFAKTLSTPFSTAILPLSCVLSTTGVYSKPLLQMVVLTNV